MQRGSLPRLNALLTSCEVHPRNLDNHKTATFALTTRLRYFFCWFVGDAQLAMRIVGNAHEWGQFLCGTRGLIPGAKETLIAAWRTRRELPIPRYLWPVVEGANQPLIARLRPGTYGNATLTSRGAEAD